MRCLPLCQICDNEEKQNHTEGLQHGEEDAGKSEKHSVIGIMSDHR